LITRTLLKNITAQGKIERFPRTLNSASPLRDPGDDLQAIHYRLQSPRPHSEGYAN